MKTAITIIIVALLGWGAYAFMDKDVAEAPAPSAPAVAPEVREFTVVGKNFYLSPATIQVKKGVRVRIVFQNQGGSHDLVIDEFGARTKVLGNGQSETIEFTADQVGSFEYYCSIGTHRQMGMKCTLVVE